jgi:hypothetical protein
MHGLLIDAPRLLAVDGIRAGCTRILPKREARKGSHAEHRPGFGIEPSLQIGEFETLAWENRTEPSLSQDPSCQALL